MNDLLVVNYENDRPTVSARELHEFLEIGTAYKDWFPRMCEYGFSEGTDFCSFLSESTGGRPAADAQPQRAMNLGLFEIKERTINSPNGSVLLTRTIRVTGKGQKYFINKFLGKESS